MQVNYCFGCMEHIESYPCPHCGYAPGSVSAYALRPGTILRGKYLVGKVLGQGGFGITYIGMDLALQRKVAIKEFYPASCVGRESGTSRVLWYDTLQAQNAMQSGQETFLKEARKMSRVSNISTVVHVFDVFQENGTAYICMEFIEGQTLQQLLKLTDPLPWVKARAIFLPVIQTMAEVHRQGLVHRDLSPDNLMIRQDGTVKILDLGAAKDLNLNAGISSMQVAKGGFSPLEQYLSSGESGSWTDVYALAATLYYALTGVVPPTAMDRLNRDTLRWDLPQLQTLPTEVYKALNHALAVRKEDRTQTMENFAAELEHTVSRTAKTGSPFNIKAAVADFAAESKQISNRIFKSMPPINIKVAAALIAVVLLGIGILNSGKETPEKILSAPETTAAVPEATETVPETTEPTSSISVAEAEALIADIAGMTEQELHTKYNNLTELEKFWVSEGTPVTTPGIGPVEEQTTATPLIDRSGNLCGWKYLRPKEYTGDRPLEYFDAYNRMLLTKHNADSLAESRKRYFYDSDGILTRTIFVGTNIVDSRYTGDGKTLKYQIIISFDSNSPAYFIEVNDSDNNCVLRKNCDSNPKTSESVSSISVAEAETLIADIAGMTEQDLRAKYDEAIKLEKFWESEGKTVETSPFSGLSENLENFGLCRTTPLLDKFGNTCGQKYVHPKWNPPETRYTDIHGDTIWEKGSSGTIKNFYDSDGLRTRSIKKTDTSIVDYRYTGDGGTLKYEIYILFDNDDSIYTIKVYDSDNICALQKEYDFNGNLIS